MEPLLDRYRLNGMSLWRGAYDNRSRRLRVYFRHVLGVEGAAVT
jgi:hypothetical protein